MQDYVTIQAFAKHFGVTSQRIWQKVKRREISAVRFSDIWMIPRAELSAWVKIRVKTKMWLFKKSSVKNATENATAKKGAINGN